MSISRRMMIAAGGGVSLATIAFAKAQSAMAETFSVKDYGAVGDGSNDDTAAIQAAIDASYQTAIARTGTVCVVLPAGVYRVSYPIEIRRSVAILGLGFPIIVAHHDSHVFRVSGIPGVNIFPDNKVIFESLSFKNSPSYFPSSYIQLGTSDSSPITYVNSANDVEINRCFFQNCRATYAVDNNRGFGLTLHGCMFTAMEAKAALKLRQSANEVPFWSYAVNIYSSDFTGVTGKAIEADGGDVSIFGGIIEGCSSGGVDVGTNPAYLGTQPVSFHGTYFEGNKEFHFKAGNSRVVPSFFGCKFVSGGASGNKLEFASAVLASFYNCTSPNNAPTIVGGNVRQYGCVYMAQNVGKVDSFLTDCETISTGSATTSISFGPRLNVNGGLGGGGALIICSHSTVGSISCNAELFFVMLGVNGNKFEARSVTRIEASDNCSYLFSVDTHGYLEVRSSTGGFAKYHIITTTNGIFLP